MRKWDDSKHVRIVDFTKFVFWFRSVSLIGVFCVTRTVKLQNLYSCFFRSSVCIQFCQQRLFISFLAKFCPFVLLWLSKTVILIAPFFSTSAFKGSLYYIFEHCFYFLFVNTPDLFKIPLNCRNILYCFLRRSNEFDH